MKRLLIFFLILSAILMVSAMDRRLEDINAVKRDTTYLYAEATMKTQSDAAKVANELLQEEIIRWTAEQQHPMDSLTACQLSLQADTMVMRRAEMYRVFTYMKKDQILSGPQKAEIAESVEPKDSTLLTDSARQILFRRFLPPRDHGVLKKILRAKNFFELKDIMEPLKKSGEITAYGKYATIQNPQDCYLIIYDPAGNICALLDKGGDPRKNLKTGKKETVQSYRGCGAIWFTLK